MKNIRMWQEDVVIPTYPVGAPEKNPMFFEKRVFQGSSGKIYPNPVTEKLNATKVNKSYKALFLENQYLKLMVLPEIGGRLHRCYDNINQRELIYYNRVIKPALIGPLGPWISGGIEFNYPTHHRPSGFEPMEYLLETAKDGSKIIWVSEVERMQRTRVTTGFALHPDHAYLEIKVKLYNRTPLLQSFLWWTNPALHTDDSLQTVFPPDVNAVFDHGRRDVSQYPFAKGTYYNWDYSAGVDISWFKNVIVPSSFMVADSDLDFMGGYYHSAKAGMLHVANHHISPGKKLFTWGKCDFSNAWYRQLTDEDGPYIELMTGAYSDNQPDFAWLHPFEEKSFSQFFMAYKGIQSVKNANTAAVVNLEKIGRRALVQLNVTAEHKSLRIHLTGKKQTYLETTRALKPGELFEINIPFDKSEAETDLLLTVHDRHGQELIRHRPAGEITKPIPHALAEPDRPEELATTEELYLHGLHLEQYKHATIDPAPYYLEALRRDDSDARCNNAYGLWLLRRGRFAESEVHFRKAIAKLTRLNLNPLDGEPLYHLGLALKFQQKFDEAYKWLYKSAWNHAWQDAAFCTLAQLDAIRGNYPTALTHLSQALSRNGSNHKARHLRVALLRRSAQPGAALQACTDYLQDDPFDYGLYYEKHLLLQKSDKQRAGRSIATLKELIQNKVQTYIEYAFDYGQAGLYDEAASFLRLYLAGNRHKTVYPLVLYILGCYLHKLGKVESAMRFFRKAAAQKPDYCFPHQLEAIEVLETAIRLNPKDGMARYYLGNLFYDKEHPEKAIELWEASRALNPKFPTVHRNLALPYYNKRHEPAKALESLERAFRLNPSDHRIFSELDQLRRKLNWPPQERYREMKRHESLVDCREDMLLQKATVCNSIGDYQAADSILCRNVFHPWEASEGRFAYQYQLARVQLARKRIGQGRFDRAAKLLLEALVYPLNLGEGKLPNVNESNIYYYLGCAYEGLGDAAKARESFEQAVHGRPDLGIAMFYNDQPADNMFYRGLAYEKLGNLPQARSCFNRLMTYGQQHMSDSAKIDFFVLQLADTVVFNADLDKLNRAHCEYLIGLGHLGYKQYEQALNRFAKVLDIDANHQGAIVHRILCRNEALSPALRKL